MADGGAPRHNADVTTTTSTVRWLDAQGRETGPDDAVAAEVHHHDAEGNEVGRTYADLTGGDPRPAPDEVVDPANADALKASSWDLWDMEAGGPLRTLPALTRVLGVDESPVPAQRRALAEFMLLPAWQAAPAQLRRAVSAFLASTRPAGGQSADPGGQP